MDEDDLGESLKLSVEFSNDSTLLEIRPADSNKNGTSSWTREKILAYHPADNVFLYKSTCGELRVVKRIRRQDGGMVHRRELYLMKRVLTEVEPQQKELFVDLIGWFPSTDHIYFVLEYCPYGDISHHFTPALETDAWWICRQLIEGLAVLHKMGIIHRDIKPQNVLVCGVNPTQVKIADFGISKLAHTDDAHMTTQPTTRSGTYGYMAPERLNMIEIEGHSHTPAIDIWSLGCVIYYLLAGSEPFTKMGSKSYKALEDYCDGILSFPEAPLARNGISISAQHFIQRLLAPLPQNRPQACEKLMNDWELPLSCFDDLPPPSKQSDDLQLSFTRNTNTAQSEERFPYADHFPDDEPDIPSVALWNLIKSGARGQLDWDRLRSLLLIDKASPDIYIQGYTALHIAAEQGTIQSIQELLGDCADPSARTETNQETAIHLATVQADVTSFNGKLMLLLERNVDINACNAQRETALHLAIRRMGSVEAITLLLEKGASTESPGRHGRTPLQYAVYLEREELVDVLLRHGASPYCEDDDGTTPLHIAAKSKKLSISLLERLIGNGHYINNENKENYTPLFAAASAGRSDVIRLLADRGAKCRPHSVHLEARISQAYERPLFNLRMPWLSWSNPSS